MVRGASGKAISGWGDDDFGGSGLYLTDPGVSARRGRANSGGSGGGADATTVAAAAAASGARGRRGSSAVPRTAAIPEVNGEQEGGSGSGGSEADMENDTGSEGARPQGHAHEGGYDSDEESAHEDVEVVAYGSRGHVHALRARMEYLENERRQAAVAAGNLNAELSQLANEFQRVAMMNKEYDLEDEDSDALHVTEEMFGYVPIQNVERPNQSHRMVRRPYLRQYWEDGVLMREKEERKTSWSELFLDLVFVAAVATLGHQLIDDFEPWKLHRYIVLFIPVRQIWSDIRT